jgi:hypothetical protein
MRCVAWCHSLLQQKNVSCAMNLCDIAECALQQRRAQDDVDPYEVFIQMESLLDKLKLLNYDKGFCQPEKMKPIPKHYFALQGSTSDQLYYFGKLVAWLISLCGQKFAAPDQVRIFVYCHSCKAVK